MGTKFPKGVSPIFPPRDWSCPICNKYHGKPHFAWEDQVNEDISPNTKGRVLFNLLSNGKPSYPLRSDLLDKQAPMYDENDDPKPLFCPHCGYLHQGIIIKRVDRVFSNGDMDLFID